MFNMLVLKTFLFYKKVLELYEIKSEPKFQFSGWLTQCPSYVETSKDATATYFT